MAKFVFDHKNPRNIQFSSGLWHKFLKGIVKHKKRKFGTKTTFFFFVF